VVQSSTDRLKSLVGNLLDMSRISSDSVQVLHEPVTWLDVVPEALAGVPEGAVRVELAPNLPPIDADRGLLERALANIVENAVKYAPGTDVLVQATAGSGVQVGPDGRPYSELRVVDYGGGVPASRVVAMFQPFQRLNDSSAGAGAGAGIGLGLAVAKGFVEAMDGELLAEETPGGGLTMAVRLPLYMGSTESKDDQ
jgi:two-component system sensor histidine kinase KdpD